MEWFRNKKLNEILKTLNYQTKLLESLVETLDARQYEHNLSKMEINKNITASINNIASQVEGTPFAAMLRETAKSMMGGKHGR
jgi:hypothetical protein